MAAISQALSNAPPRMESFEVLYFDSYFTKDAKNPVDNEHWYG